VEDWDSRNLLYSLTWNICNALFVPGSTQKEPYVYCPIKPVITNVVRVFHDMITLCERICPHEIQSLLGNSSVEV
jgi:hypothetical protein